MKAHATPRPRLASTSKLLLDTLHALHLGCPVSGVRTDLRINWAARCARLTCQHPEYLDVVWCWCWCCAVVMMVMVVAVVVVVVMMTMVMMVMMVVVVMVMMR